MINELNKSRVITQEVVVDQYMAANNGHSKTKTLLYM